MFRDIWEREFEAEGPVRDGEYFPSKEDDIRERLSDKMMSNGLYQAKRGEIYTLTISGGEAPIRSKSYVRKVFVESCLEKSLPYDIECVLKDAKYSRVEESVLTE